MVLQVGRAGVLGFDSQPDERDLTASGLFSVGTLNSPLVLPIKFSGGHSANATVDASGLKATPLSGHFVSAGCECCNTWLHI